MKRKDIRLKYSDIIDPKYAYFKLIPSSGINSYDSSELSLLANQLFKTIFSRIHFIEKHVFMEKTTSIRYLIDITKNSVDFYYIIPEQFKFIAIDTIAKTWNGKCTVQEVHKESIRILNNPTVYQMRYKYEDFLSLKTDAKSNKFLYKALSILEIMNEGDNVQLVVNLIPGKRDRSTWKTYCDDIYDRYMKGLPIQKSKIDIDYVFNLIRSALGEVANLLLPDSLRNNAEYKVPGTKEGLKDNTLRKAKASDKIIDTQIAVLTKSMDKTHEDILAKSFCTSFNELNGDNELIPNKYRKKDHNVSPLNPTWNICINKLAANEISSLLTIAGQNILKKFKSIEHVYTKQVDVIPELLEGTSILGYQTHSFNKIKYVYYLNDLDDYAYLPIIVLTKMGGGKSSWFENIGVSVMNSYKKNKDKKKKESLFCIDFIKQNELSYNIMYNMNPEDIILIDLSTSEGLDKLGLYFKEALIHSNNTRDIINFASSQGSEMMHLINSINVGVSDPLTGPMMRYLSSAFQICYIHQNKTLKDAMDILQDYETRHEYINMIPESMTESLKYEVKALLELDDEDKGTKHKLISGIITRVYKLMSNPTLKDLYTARPKDGVDLLEAIQSGKGIFITMPDDAFDDDTINIISTYLISRLFFVCKRRGSISKHNLTRCTLLVDEINIAPGCLKTLDKIIGKLRKYKLRAIISAHNFEQIKTLKTNINSMGVSLVLPQGSHKSNFMEFENEFKQDGFYLEDLQSLKKHETLNLIETSEGKKAFISKLPPPVEGKIEDREDIELMEFKEIVNQRIKNIQMKNSKEAILNMNKYKDTNNMDKNIDVDNEIKDIKIENNLNINTDTNTDTDISIDSTLIDIKNLNKREKIKTDSNIENLSDEVFNELFKDSAFSLEEDDDIYDI